MKKCKIGLLPLYLKLYDECVPERRPDMEAFANLIAEELRKRGIDVVQGDICRLADEFRDCIAGFEQEKVDAIVSLHLAYSPSLESIDVLAGTQLPLLILDTTPDFEFGPDQVPEKIMFNHGIHGVQDMCNLLLRRRKRFVIEAGHWQQSDVIDRICDDLKAAKLATSMRNARVGIVGEPFRGMGDFALPFDVLRETIGMQTITADSATLSSLLPGEKDAEVVTEMQANLIAHDCDLGEDVHERSVRAGLTMRKWIEKENLSAFTVNFLAVNKDSVLPTVPFLEACKAMARGLGYAGEGDVMTAALVGALASVYSETTFTEMFCPDWRGNSVFMSHMGEANIDLLDDVKITEYDFPFTDTENPAKSHGRLKQGQAVLINLAPSCDNHYSLILAPVEVMGVKEEDKMAGSMRGWIRPEMSLDRFLAEYSQAGGTHHSALVYNADLGILEKFAGFMQWQTVILK